MYKNLHFEGMLINGNEWNEWQFYLRIGAIRLHRVTSKKSDYIFEDLPIYVFSDCHFSSSFVASDIK